MTTFQALSSNPMQEYRTSLRRKQIHQGTVSGVEVHEPHGKKMECALVRLNNGLKGLIFADQFDKHKFRSLVGFIDHRIDFMVLDVQKMGLDPNQYQVFDEEKGVVLLSRVQAIEELQEEFWETAEEGHVVTGTVSGWEESRLYILVKGVSCVLAIQDYEYDWTPSAKNLVPLGTSLTVKIIEIDRENQQVKVSRKELLEDPWNRVRENFGVDNFYAGEITGVVENVGIFVKIAPGIEVLSWFPKRLPSHGQLIGKHVSVKIKSIDAERRRIKARICKFPHEIY